MTGSPDTVTPHQVVVIGGGFGGLNVVKKLRFSPVAVKLIDKRNFHLFQPLLYQVAGGALSPANIASPLRQVFVRQKNCHVLLGRVVRIDPHQQLVFTDDDVVHYDSLVVAAGSTHTYFGHDAWEELAPSLKTVEDATEIRSRILSAFEKAEVETDPELRKQLLTFVIVGGGPTGVELAGALADISRRSLKHDFRNINPFDSKIMLVEGSERVLTPFPPKLSAKASRSLKRLGVEIRSNTRVTDICDDHVILKPEDGGPEERIATSTVLWAAGVKAVPLGQQIAEVTGAPIDRSGQVTVEPDLSVPGFPNLFIIGDMAKYTHQGDAPLPGVAPVAIQQGRFLAKLIDARLHGRPLPKFHYHDRGNLAAIGKWHAVADFQWIRFSGITAWMLWLFVHLMYITGFRNRLLVLIQWGWNFLTNDRSARLITGQDRPDKPASHLSSAKDETADQSATS